MSVRTFVCEFQTFIDDVTTSPSAGFTKTGRRSGSPGREYDYLYTGSRNVRPGDWAIVHNGSEFGIVTILRVRPGITDKVRKHVLQVITQDDFETYKEANKSIVNHRQVYDELDYMLEQKKKTSKYEELAQTNTYARELLNKLNVYNGPSLEHMDKPFSFDDGAAKPTVQETLKPTSEPTI